MVGAGHNLLLHAVVVPVGHRLTEFQLSSTSKPAKDCSWVTALLSAKQHVYSCWSSSLQLFCPVTNLLKILGEAV